MSKVCTVCKKKKSDDDFFFRDKKTGRRHAQCKDCYRDKRHSRKHYEKYRDQYIERAKARKRRLYADNFEKIVTYLEKHPCVDCGEDDVIVLDFHHRDRKKKSFNICAKLSRYSWDKISKEIAKCVIVCANCHRRRTAKELGWKRGRISPGTQMA